MRLVIFGVSNMLGDIFDCALAQRLTPSLIVMNCPEVIRPRTKSVAERVKLLPAPPKIIDIEIFEPRQGECYFLGTTSPSRQLLVDDIRTRFGIVCCSLIHPGAYVSPLASLGDGVFVGAGSVIAPGSNVGNHVFISRNVTVGHDAVIEPYANLRVGSNVGGHTRVGQNAIIGMGANVIEELVIGENAFVGAGAVVLQDVADRTLVVGVPAKFKKHL